MMVAYSNGNGNGMRVAIEIEDMNTFEYVGVPKVSVIYQENHDQ